MTCMLKMFEFSIYKMQVNVVKLDFQFIKGKMSQINFILLLNIEFSNLISLRYIYIDKYSIMI